MLAAGFQAAIRRADGPRAGRSAGTLRPRDARVAVVPSEDGRVRYAQHARQGTPADGERAEWRLDWVAPEEGGRLALHVAANSGNGDNSPLDDLVYTLSASLLPEGR